MNIKKRIPKFLSLLLCFSMTFGNMISAYAMENTSDNSTTVIDGENISTEERNLEDITVTYKQASSFFVTIPKTIVLDGWKQSTYAVKVSGDIGSEQCVYVAPVDMIDTTENIDFLMKDQASENAKDDVVASVTHNKFHWNSTEVAGSYKQDDNVVSAPDLTAGAWKGIFQMEIKLETHVTHKHNYVETITKEPTCTETGEKKYTCDCGNSYTEVIPAKGHHFENGECTDCHEKDPNHEHSYTETITKQATCTEAGEKTFTCTCGHSYTEEIPAKGHHFVDGECTDCGEKDPCSESHTDENEDDICDICGHEHQWVENKDVLEWVRYNPYGRAGWTKNGNTYEATFSADKTDATKSASIDFDIDVPNDVECTYSFTCPYLYKTDFMYYDNAWAFLYDLDDSGNTIDTASNPRTTIFDVKGAGSGNSSGTISLSKGKHRLSVLYHKGNESSAVSGKVRITLSTMEALNHVCTGCGEKRAHNYTETVIKEATCVENGEKEYVCETCGYSYVEEIEATGEHNYVNGICTMCGKANIATTEIYSISSTTSRTTDSGHGHYDQTSLSGTYSPDIEIAENMAEDEYLVLNSYMGYPVIGGQGQYGESDGINGSSQLQKYDEETDTWKTIDTHTISYNIVNNITEQTGGYKDLHRGCGISRKYQLEKGTYRIYGSFSAHRSCASSVAHYYYSYRITAYLCQIEK